MSRGELSPLDGRYRSLTDKIRSISSERKLVQRRIAVEAEYLIKLIDTLGIADKNVYDYNAEISPVLGTLLGLAYNQTHAHIESVFEFEKTTDHDVKAVELAIREVITAAHPDNPFAARIVPFVHFGLTSQDINSVCVTMECRDLVTQCVIPTINGIISDLCVPVSKYYDLTMLSRTHGQPATPTTLGKEFNVFVERLQAQLLYLTEHHVWTTKFGGATGGFNAHHFVYPYVDWENFADQLLYESFGLKRQQYTTQIEHYDGLAAVFDAVKRINVILIDLCSDIWHYISFGYLKQTPVAGTVGSSTMPHKINPIRFENAEGNLMLANTLLEFMSRKLPVSRMQRDLTDSTVTRNIGTSFGYAMVGWTNIQRGLKTIDANKAVIAADLRAHPEVITEGLQTAMRAAGNTQAYETFHKWLREHPNATLDDIRAFVATATGSDYTARMLKLTPETYGPVLRS